ncbi:MAG: Opr family porin [Arcobacteraceae bacterium]
MRKISLITSAVLLSSTVAMADSNSIKEAFANGKTSGDVTVYGESIDNKNAKDTGLVSGSIGLNYETDTFKGFSASLGFRANHEFQEVVDTSDVDPANHYTYDNTFANSAIMNVAAVKYATDAYFISVGRQEIDLEWLGDFNEAVVAGITAVPNTTIVVGYTDRQAEIGFDTTADFTEITKKGAYVIDVKNTSVENLELNPYFYSAPDEADFYGLKVSYDTDMFGATAHYATTNQDSTSVVTVEDGDIAHVEGRLNVAGIAFAAGYIKTDTNGTGSLTAYGDNISPFEDGNNTYGSDAKTYYGSVGYEIIGIELAALYGQTKYDDGGTQEKENELNLSVGYSFTEELSAALMYVDYNDKSAADEDYDKVLANVTYSF